MDFRIGILIILLVFACYMIPMIVICKDRVKPILAGVYEIKTGNARVTVIGIAHGMVLYEFEDPDDFDRLKTGSMKLTEFDNIFTYLYTDYKTLVYKINKKN